MDIWTGFVEKKINLDVTKKMWKGEATPNGIAYHYDFEPVSLLVTGKLWDAMYVLELTDNELCGDGWSVFFFTLKMFSNYLEDEVSSSNN